MLKQKNLIIDMIEQDGMKNWKPCSFPFPKGVKLFLDKGDMLEDPEIYRSIIIGKLSYLNLTRLDISYFVQ